MANKISVDVTVGTDGLVTGIKVAGKSVEDVSQAMQTSLANAGAAAERAGRSFAGAAQGMGGSFGGLKGASAEAGQSFESMGSSAAKSSEGVHTLGGAIKEYRSEIRTEGRYSKFLANDIASMGIASKSAAGEVTMLASAFAFGGGIGVAVEVIKMAVKALMELSAEEDKFAADVKKVWADASKAVVSFRDEINLTILALGGASHEEQMWASKVLPLLKEQSVLKQDLIQKNTALSAVTKDAKLATQSEAELTAAVRNEAHAVTLATEALAAKTLEIKEQQDQIKRLATAQKEHDETHGDSSAAAKINAQRLQSSQDLQLKLDEIHARGLEGAEKLEAEYVIRTEQIRQASTAKIKQILDESRDKGEASQAASDAAIAKERVDVEKRVTAELLDYREQFAKNAAEIAKKWAATEQQFRNMNIKAEFQASEAIKKFHADQANYQVKRAEDVSREETKQMQEVFTVTKSIASGIGSALAGVVDGTQSVGKAVANMASVAIKAIIDIAIKTVEANAVNAASGAAAAESGIPIIGPALAVGAMIAMEAIVLGLLGSIPSASGGFDIPASVNPITQLHGGEMVLPREHADTIRGMSDGGGMGGELHLHVHALDSDGVERYFGSPVVQRKFKTLQRTGRWA